MNVLSCHEDRRAQGTSAGGWSGIPLMLLLLAGLLGGCGVPEKETASAVFSPADNPWTQGENFSGRRVLIAGPYAGIDAERFAASLEAFGEVTGIEVSYVSDAADGAAPGERAAPGDGAAPGIIVFSRPDQATRSLQQGQLVSPDRWFGQDYLKEQYHESLLDIVSFDGRAAALWYRVNIRGLVWYSVPVFERECYRVPGSREELERLSERMIADGYTPWSIGIESGEAAGWVAADWIEEILLRSAGEDAYDSWVSGELPFSSEEVEAAFRILGDIWFDPEQVLGGREKIISTSFTEGALPLTSPEPAALMHLQGDFLPAFFPDGTRIGGEIDCFYLPGESGHADTEVRRPMIITGECIGALNARPETAALMRYFSQGISAMPWIEQGGCLSPHNDAQRQWYRGRIESRYDRIFRSADLYRFDASQLMPPQAGAGSFPEEMTALIQGKNLKDVLQSIDRSRKR